MTCNCNDKNCMINNNPQSMYSVDYDTLIENLTSTRDQIDSLIQTLEDRKAKDAVINNILSSEYEEEPEDDELPDWKILKLKKIPTTNTRLLYPYFPTYVWWNQAFPKRYYEY